jgi:hypothetical protein
MTTNEQRLPTAKEALDDLEQIVKRLAPPSVSLDLTKSEVLLIRAVLRKSIESAFADRNRPELAGPDFAAYREAMTQTVTPMRDLLRKIAAIDAEAGL